MSKKIYIGNLSFKTTEDTLNSYFAPYGVIEQCRIVCDKATGMSKGFGFVDFADDAQTDKLIAELSGKELDGRKVRINYAQ